MAVNAFLTFFDKADGESMQKGKWYWVGVMCQSIWTCLCHQPCVKKNLSYAKFLSVVVKTSWLLMP